MSDALYDGQKIKLLTLMDNYTRESLAIEVVWRLGGHGVVAALMQIAEEKGPPKSIRIDNGPEFTSKALDQWAYLNGVELDFIRPGKPTDNALIESFNETLQGRMPERELVPVTRRCPRENRDLAATLQP